MSRRTLILSASGAAALLALLVWLAVRGGGVLDRAEERSEPKGKHEELVRNFVLNQYPVKIAFLRWGPHMSGDEWRAIAAKSEEVPDVLIRVLFRGESEGGKADIDRVFSVFGNRVEPFPAAPEGDDWKKVMLNLKSFPR